MIVGAAAWFSAFFFATAIVGVALPTLNAGTRSAKLLLIPVAGPFALVDHKQGTDTNAVLVLDGLAQLACAIALVDGIAQPKTALVRDTAPKVKVTPHPMAFGRSGGGIGLTGTF